MGKWVKDRLDSFCHIEMGQSPDSSGYNSEGVGLPLIQGNADIKNRKTIKRNFTSIITKTSLPGEIILTVRAPVGNVAVATDECCLGRGVCAISSSNVDKHFLYHALIWRESEWQKLEQGSTFTAVGHKEVESFSIEYPILENEQRHIAEILTTCDEVIEKSEAVVEKYRAIKAGMLKDLFTRGIGKNGKLRPPPESAPQLYKDTALGKVPREWEMKRVGELGDFKNGISKGGSAFGHGTPFVNLLDVFGKDILCDVRGLGLVETTPTEREQCSLRCGDVLFVRSSVKPTGVGLTTVVLKDLLNTVFSGFLLRYRANGLAPEFARYIFREDKFRARVMAVSAVSANTNVNQTSLKTLCIAFPQNMHEQRQIAERLSAIDAKIADELAVIAKYRKVKMGLMARLLTPPDGEVE